MDVMLLMWVIKVLNNRIILIIDRYQGLGHYLDILWVVGGMWLVLVGLIITSV